MSWPCEDPAMELDTLEVTTDYNGGIGASQPEAGGWGGRARSPSCLPGRGNYAMHGRWGLASSVEPAIGDPLPLRGRGPAKPVEGAARDALTRGRYDATAKDTINTHDG
jgi:hypothetical protein